jgi:predicted metalloprotease with PDZ domain
VINESGRLERSAVQMSQYAPFSDAAVAIDMTDANRTFISYYTYGAAIAIALDLSLREQSGGKTTLDDFMRAMWAGFGKPGGPAPGLVGKPYTLKDVRDVLAQVSGNRAFADSFVDKYIEGREVADYAHLLSLAGYILRAARPTAGWIGNVAVQPVNGGLVVGLGGRGQDGDGQPVPFTAPLYAAGVDEGDFITSIDGQAATSAGWAAIARKHPGETVSLVIVRRDGATVTKTVTVKADPALQVEPIEASGGALTPAQQAFRATWLGSKVR